MRGNIIWSRQDLESALAVQLSPTLEAITGSVQFNSQDVSPGDIFIALNSVSGRDAHSFVADALNNGAVVAIISKPIIDIDVNRVILVDDTHASLLKLAQYRRQQLKDTKFIGITGSVGKTSSKEIMLHAFSTVCRTFASRKNFNNFLGVQLNLASIPLETEYAIFELGMSHAGDLTQVAKILALDIAIINNIDYAHTEFFSSMQHLVAAKCEIFSSLKKNGVAIINADDKFYNEQVQHLNSNDHHEVYFFGTNLSVDSRLAYYNYDNSEQRALIKVNIGGQEYSLRTQIRSYGQALNITAVLLVGKICNFDLTKLVSAINILQNFEGRGRIYSFIFNNKHLSIIDDCYNANPKSMQNALRFLSEVHAHRKVAILGDMLELGAQSHQHHINLIKYIKNCGIDRVIAIGKMMYDMYKLLPITIQLRHYSTVHDLLADLENVVEDRDYILIKGSNRMQLRLIVEKIFHKGEIVDVG